MSLLPVVIFLAEMCVVTLGILRIIFISRGNKAMAPLLGFFEVLTWLFAISKVMQNLGDGACFLAFALGFTLGNFFGILIEKKLALGMAIVRIITNQPPETLIEQLRAARFGVTTIEGRGASGPVQIVMTVVRRRQLDEVCGMIEAHQPSAFYAVDELQTASEGIFRECKSMIPVLPSALKFLGGFRGSHRSVASSRLRQRIP